MNEPVALAEACQRPAECFLIPQATHLLNVAGQAPQLRAVQTAAERALGASLLHWRISAEAWLARGERVREAAAALLGAEARSVALVPSVSYGMRLAAELLPLPRGSSVLVLADEHPSCTATWAAAAARSGAELRAVRRRAGRTWTENVLAQIDERSRIVAVPACHWHDGAALDLQAIAGGARSCGAALVIDASQAWGVLPIDLAALDPDLVISAANKWLLGPPGLAYAWIAERHHAQAPLEQHAFSREGDARFDAIDVATAPFRDGARRFDAGGIHAGIALDMAAPALAQLQQWGVAQVRDRLKAWQRSLLEALDELGLANWIVVADSPHITALRAPPGSNTGSAAIVAALAAEGFSLAARGGLIRVSPHLHVEADVAHALAAALLRWG
jgi:selenocysteine lyase/cysteine desulfurase